MGYKNEIYLGTVCIEKNRWANTQPSIKVSDYMDRIQEAGFDGIELWEDHVLMTDETEIGKIANHALPIKLLNTYALGDAGHDAKREASLNMAKRLKVEGIKFNFGRDFSDIPECVVTMDNWLGKFPKNTRLLCEYHPGFNVSFDDIFAAEEYSKYMKSDVMGIIHPFNGSTDGIYKYFKHFGDRITHIHVQMLRKRDTDIAKTLRILRKCGFDGSFTIEFTHGVAEQFEDIDYVLDNAIRDMQLLRYHLDNE